MFLGSRSTNFGLSSTMSNPDSQVPGFDEFPPAWKSQGISGSDKPMKDEILGGGGEMKDEFSRGGVTSQWKMNFKHDSITNLENYKAVYCDDRNCENCENVFFRISLSLNSTAMNKKLKYSNSYPITILKFIPDCCFKVLNFAQFWTFWIFKTWSSKFLRSRFWLAHKHKGKS